MRRKVICGDAFELLSTIKCAKAVITSLPDAAELRDGLAGYQAWFTEAAVLNMNAISDDGVAIFYQTDRRHDGILLSKGTLLCNAAHSQGLRLLWHKIVLKSPVETVNTFRPSYAHMMAFSKLLRS